MNETHRRHRVYTRRKKAVMLIAGLLLLPVALAMIVRFDQGPLGDSFAQLIGATPASGLVEVAQVTTTPSATPVTPEATLFQPPRQTPLPTETATAIATLFQPPRQTPLPTETATAVATLFEPPRQTPLPTETATAIATLFEPPRQTPLPTETATPVATLFEPPRQTPLPTETATAAVDVVDTTGTPAATSGTDATPSATGEPPKVLPTTGLMTELPMQSIGFALLFLSLMFIAAGLRRGTDDQW